MHASALELNLDIACALRMKEPYFLSAWSPESGIYSIGSTQWSLWLSEQSRSLYGIPRG